MRFFVWALLTALVPFSVHATQTLRWERIPLPVTLNVGEERVIFTDREMRVGVPANLKDRLRVQSTGGAVYLRAAAEFRASRVQLQDVATNSIVLLDVSAIDAEGQETLVPLRIVLDPPRQEKDKAEEQDRTVAQPGTPVPIVLVRHAAQNLYGPLRAVEPVPGLSRAFVRDDLPLGTLLPTLPVSCRVLAAWQLDGHTVTALLIRNTSPQPLALDARDLQGNFIAATFQHSNLGPVGEVTDTTVLYLVTRGKGLADSLLPASMLQDNSVSRQSR
jgi:integrating conjugative element protein (TIGR03749 family)